MALFENIFGTRPLRRGEFRPESFRPAPFRKPGRLEGDDPEAREAYEEEKRAYEEDMRASMADTEGLLGKEWRKRAFEKSKAEEPRRAQQALAETAAANRGLRETELPPMPEEDAEGDEMVDLPGGGKASADTIRMLYKKKGERQAEKEAKETAFGRNIEARYAAAYEANKKRYEEELASRGFTPPKTREEENVYNRLRMEDFRLARQAREKQDTEEKLAVQAYRDYKAAAREARRRKDFEAAAGFDAKAEEENISAGGTLENASARRKHFQDIGMLKLRDELEARAADRREAMKKQTGANEVAISTAEPPIEPPSSPPQTEPPITPPEKPTEIPPFEDVIDLPEPNIPKPKSAPTQPFRPPTSKDRTPEDTLPGISSMPPIPMPPNATPAERKAHNAKVLDQYEKNIILPSLSEEVQSAFLNAKELNEQEKELFSRRFISPDIMKRYKEVSKQAKEQHGILKSEIDALRKNSRNLAGYPLGSPQRKLNAQKIATLRKQLGFFAKRLY
jgi:hypothetical protein